MRLINCLRSMNVYNKLLAFTGFIIGALGVCIDNIYVKMWLPGVVFMLLGAVMILWSMKKPKN
jgi:hypothetical protein